MPIGTVSGENMPVLTVTISVAARSAMLAIRALRCVRFKTHAPLISPCLP